MLKIKYDGYQPGLASMLYQFFDKKSVATHSNTSGGAIKKEVISNHQLDEKRHKPNIRKLKKNVRYTLLLKITLGVLILYICN